MSLKSRNRVLVSETGLWLANLFALNLFARNRVSNVAESRPLIAVFSWFPGFLINLLFSEMDQETPHSQGQGGAEASRGDWITTLLKSMALKKSLTAAWL